MADNNRAHARYDVSCRIDYVDPNGNAGLGLIRDVSREGIYVDFTSGLQVGDIMTASFTLPDSPPVRLRVRVMRLTKSGAGLKFVGLAEHGDAPAPDNLETLCTTLYDAWVARTP